MPLGQQGVHRAYPALQNELVQDGLTCVISLVLSSTALLGQRQAHVVGQRRQQMDPRRALLARAPQRFAIKRHGGFAR
jgi:hypothetical protein